MAKTVKRRRIEGKTDYKSRLALLKSEKPRLVVRKTNKYIIAQIVSSETSKDKVLIGLSSKALISKGWSQKDSGSLKSLTAAYLTGLLIGKIGKEKVKEAILDQGMHRTIQGSRIYALLKGAIDSGLSIPHNPEVLPSLEKIKSNEKLSHYLEKIKGEI
jgi:large subunit ribosomal protein L18